MAGRKALGRYRNHESLSIRGHDAAGEAAVIRSLRAVRVTRVREVGPTRHPIH